MSLQTVNLLTINAQNVDASVIATDISNHFKVTVILTDSKQVSVSGHFADVDTAVYALAYALRCNYYQVRAKVYKLTSDPVNLYQLDDNPAFIDLPYQVVRSNGKIFFKGIEQDFNNLKNILTVKQQQMILRLQILDYVDDLTTPSAKSVTGNVTVDKNTFNLDFSATLDFIKSKSDTRIIFDNYYLMLQNQDLKVAVGQVLTDVLYTRNTSNQNDVSGTVQSQVNRRTVGLDIDIKAYTIASSWMLSGVITNGNITDAGETTAKVHGQWQISTNPTVLLKIDKIADNVTRKLLKSKSKNNRQLLIVAQIVNTVPPAGDPACGDADGTVPCLHKTSQ